MQDCIFCKIAKGEIPSQKVYEDDLLFAFKDISPMAPVHILVIPKTHYRSLNEVPANEIHLLGTMVEVARKLAWDQGLKEKGYRLALNTEQEGGQSGYHLHLHLLGGRQLGPSLVG